MLSEIYFYALVISFLSKELFIQASSMRSLVT
jgi:hypothetical protein